MLDERLNSPWPREVAAALDGRLQGDVIDWPIGAYVSRDNNVLWSSSGDEGGGALVVAAMDPAPPLAIITTQTCDLDEQGARPRRPWFSFAPVYQLPGDDSSRQSLLDRQETSLLTGPDLPPGDWVADLRVEFAAEKNVLVGSNPRHGFGSEADAEEFGELLGHLRARPTLANELVREVGESLVAHRRGTARGRRKALGRKIHKVCLQLDEGTRLRPVRVRVVVLCDGRPPRDVKDWFGGWYDAARGPSRAAGIRLQATQYRNARRLDAIKNDGLIVLRVF